MSDDFRARRVGVPDVAIQKQRSLGRRIGMVSSVGIVALAVWIGWLVGSGRLPTAVAALHGLLP